jgi:hypothetical protein
MNMKKKLLALLAAGSSLMMAAVLVVAAAAAPDPFKGTWYSVDPFDGSNQTLHVGGGPGSSYHVRYYDDGASVCALDLSTAASASGFLTATGTSIGDQLSGDLPVYCLASPRTWYGDLTFTFTLDGDTLVQQVQAPYYVVTWHH